MTRYKRIVCIIGIALFVLSILPLAALCAYSHPYYDDYGFALFAHEAWNTTHRVSAVIQAAFNHAKEIRQKWQGTYTGTFLTNLQPGLFGEQFYGLGPLFLLLFFAFSFYTLVYKLSRLSGHEYIESFGIAGFVVFYLLQFMPSVAEGIYWFNGGIGNTFIYSVIALSVVFVIILCTSSQKWARISAYVALLLCAILLGGGSYTGGIFALLLGAVAAVLLLLKKNKRGYLVLSALIVFCVCFLYSISAPGNRVRAGMIGASTGAVSSIVKAVYYGTALIGQYLTLPLIALTLLLLPLFIKAAKKKELCLKHPLLFGITLYLVFCAQLTPTLYSGVFLGADRTVNTYFFSFVILWLVWIYAITSYIINKIGGFSFGFSCKKSAVAYLLAAILLFGIGATGTKNGSDSYYGIQNLNSVGAVLHLVTGDAARYHAVMQKREALLNDSTQSSVVLYPIEEVPSCFMPDLLYTDAGDSIITTLRLYYHKEEILREGEELIHE